MIATSLLPLPLRPLPYTLSAIGSLYGSIYLCFRNIAGVFICCEIFSMIGVISVISALAFQIVSKRLTPLFSLDMPFRNQTIYFIFLVQISYLYINMESRPTSI